MLNFHSLIGHLNLFTTFLKFWDPLNKDSVNRKLFTHATGTASLLCIAQNA